MDIGMNKDAIISACVAGLAVGIAGLVKLIQRVVRLLKESVECALPVVSRQIIEFKSPGEKCLHLEGPRFTTAFWRAKFALKDEATGEAVPLRIVLFRTVSSGLKRVRLNTHRCMINHAGRYEFTISGIREGADSSSIGIVFTKPYRGKAMLLTLGMVFSGMLIIASIVFGLLALLGQI